ncbi:hypothetical protein [Actinoplanes sp. NPDC051851]|uniref:hypothetical protein n=1 Tax=Actinoplanes sp. NPDC051851 TaxID=3154753 RepID=UPI003443C337
MGLTSAERALLARAEEQAVAEMTFDARAGLADLYERAARPVVPPVRASAPVPPVRVSAPVPAGAAGLGPAFGAILGRAFAPARGVPARGSSARAAAGRWWRQAVAGFQVKHGAFAFAAVVAAAMIGEIVGVPLSGESGPVTPMEPPRAMAPGVHLSTGIPPGGPGSGGHLSASAPATGAVAATREPSGEPSAAVTRMRGHAATGIPQGVSPWPPVPTPTYITGSSEVPGIRLSTAATGATGVPRATGVTGMTGATGMTGESGQPSVSPSAGPSPSLSAGTGGGPGSGTGLGPGGTGPVGGQPPGPVSPMPSAYQVLYAPTSVDLAMGDAVARGVDIERPHVTTVTGDGDLRISEEPGTGELTLDRDPDLQAAVVDPAVATPDDCMAAVRSSPAGSKAMPIREGRAYCLVRPDGPGKRNTLVRFTVRRSGDGVVLRLAGWRGAE